MRFFFQIFLHDFKQFGLFFRRQSMNFIVFQLALEILKWNENTCVAPAMSNIISTSIRFLLCNSLYRWPFAVFSRLNCWIVELLNNEVFSIRCRQSVDVLLYNLNLHWFKVWRFCAHKFDSLPLKINAIAIIENCFRKNNKIQIDFGTSDNKMPYNIPEPLICVTEKMSNKQILTATTCALCEQSMCSSCWRLVICAHVKLVRHFICPANECSDFPSKIIFKRNFCLISDWT